MGLYIGGYQLRPGDPQPPRLRLRLGHGGRRTLAPPARSPASPSPHHPVARTAAAPGCGGLAAEAARVARDPGDQLPNNRCAAVRLNLAGREPYGSVQPGEEASAILEDIRSELLELEDPRGERIVLRVQTAEEAFGPDRSPTSPT